VVAISWTLSTAAGLAIVYGMTPYVDESKVPEISSAVSLTYGPLHRTAWAFVIGWIIFACSRGYGGIQYSILKFNSFLLKITYICPKGFVNRFLSWKGFLPLGRLTYCVYLIHYDYLTVFNSAIRKQYYYTMFGTVITCFGVLVFCFGLAFVAAVTIEASFLNLEKLVFSSSKSKSTKANS
jgi:peptidoglycan/LPS O-acetylase OafA/YrhL